VLLLWCRYHPRQLLLALALQAFAVCGLYLLAAWLPVHLVQLTGLPASVGLTIHTVNMAAFTGSIAMGGFLADRYGRTAMLLSTAAAAALFGYPAWLMFSLAEAGVSWFSQFTLVTFVGLHWGALASLLVEQFPKVVSDNCHEAIHHSVHRGGWCHHAVALPDQRENLTHCLSHVLTTARCLVVVRHEQQEQQATNMVSTFCSCWRLLNLQAFCSAIAARRLLSQVRASALTLAFTLPMVLLGCMAPLIALGFITQTHSLASPAILMILSAVVSGSTVLALELRKVE
jgi:MFS family permease